ncbi:putative quinol monooxygenase [Parerythrobacter jejuensis]|uniref:Antibiotic biosynthesis monooxygenase n=1 Tax=Parerythrobacter jejuensis TaxID=795812 RepID=A0A845B025_9SPHN|nr:putative quinol monooxygenase [Parerythrobacter jejuensis]MXP32338.1 antibiotic biosynthesis monooxygenase [Parerythrobacter jejuensis]
MIIITGSASIAEESMAEALRIGCEHSARSRSEPGCISHNCYIDAEDRNVIRFYEQWQDMAAVQGHFAVPESQQFVGQINALADSPPKIELFRAEALDAPF